jgi:hypothetical protein
MKDVPTLKLAHLTLLNAPLWTWLQYLDDQLHKKQRQPQYATGYQYVRSYHHEKRCARHKMTQLNQQYKRY